MTSCPLCQSPSTTDYFQDKQRFYLQCLNCQLVFVPEEFWLSPAEEKAVYDLHENDPQDDGYRKFLSRFADPLLKELSPNSTGLDFGCGPAPTLSKILGEQGHVMEIYDPIYFNNPDIFTKQYDFVCATEVVEHLKNPQKEFSKLFSLLKPGGILGVMTKLVIDQTAFSNWHYIRDLTHICFYSPPALTYLTEKYGAELVTAEKDVAFLKKRTSRF